MFDIHEHLLRIPSRDGFLLGATHYVPSARQEPEIVVIFNAGGGLSAQRYTHFLRYLASEGISVLAYDYRGVGASRPKRSLGFDAGLEDWAELDEAGVIEFVRNRFPYARVTSVSHSIGCLVACITPNASALHRMVHIGPHTGYWRDYRSPWRWPMLMMWHGAMPILARVCGHFPGSALRLGDDFPLRFALQWAGRRTPEFAISRDLGGQARANRLLEAGQKLAVPALVVTCDDDAFASDAGVARFLSFVPHLRTARHAFAPQPGERAIGHFGFFSRRNARFWPTIAHYLRDRVLSTTPDKSY